ncbi:MAG: cysteine--tRNA ligase, partial [Chlamydiia bacterium]|nr:cysteine--tRNA ligase [Chlamydiia bacterium]
MYTCGPTVYNYAHIGNFRTYVFEDLLRRSIKYFGFPLKQAMNLTDVEDKTIIGAQEKGVPLEEYTQVYKEAFFEDLKTLNIEPVEIYSPATDYIPEMIAMIETLIEKGYAYQGKDRGVYFRIKAFPSYGRLSHLKLEDLKEGASERVTDDEYDKESATDFVLWKSYDEKRDGDVFWESPFG